MRPGRAMLVFTVVVFVGGALLAPPLYWAVQWAAAHLGFQEAVARHPFHRYVHRALLGLALVGIWPLMRALGAGSWREVGWVSPRGQARRLGLGFLLGFFSLALVAALALGFGAWQTKAGMSVGKFLSRVLSSALTAAVVALIEETFFRGTLMGAFRRSHSWAVALGASSAIYALVHFLNQKPAVPGTVCWHSGFPVLAGLLSGFTDWRALVPGFFSLTLAGLILGWAYQRTGNLYFSIGLHAGWIFWLRLCHSAWVLGADAPAAVWGSARLFDGWLATGALAALLPLTWWVLRSEPDSTNAGRLDTNPAGMG